MDGCADYVAQIVGKLDAVAGAGVGLFVLIAFLAIFWAPEDRGEGEEEDRP